MTKDDSIDLLCATMRLEEAKDNCNCYPKIDGQCDPCMSMWEFQEEIRDILDRSVRNESRKI